MRLLGGYIHRRLAQGQCSGRLYQILLQAYASTKKDVCRINVAVRTMRMMTKFVNVTVFLAVSQQIHNVK